MEEEEEEEVEVEEVEEEDVEEEDAVGLDGMCDVVGIVILKPIIETYFSKVELHNHIIINLKFTFSFYCMLSL